MHEQWREIATVIAPNEEWLPIAHYEGLYEASSYGRVRSLDRVIHDKKGTTRRLIGLLLRPSTDPSGYKTVSLNKDGKARSFKTHRLVAEAFIPIRGSGLEVNHRNHNKADNRLQNLEWVTRSENKLHDYQWRDRTKYFRIEGFYEGLN